MGPAIRMLDPRAKLVSCGMNGWNDWDQVVIDGMAAMVDYHSLHIYTGSEDYWTNVMQPHQAERAIRCSQALIQRAAYRQKIAVPPRIAYDEWNVWYRNMTGALEERYNFADALAVGTYLNIFIRNCDWVRMANLAQMVNAIAPIVTSGDTAAVQPAANRGLVAITLVNRSPEEAEVAEVLLRDYTFDGPARIRTVSAVRTRDARTLPDVETAQLEEGSENTKDGVVAVRLPPRSFTVIEAAMTNR